MGAQSSHRDSRRVVLDSIRLIVRALRLSERAAQKQHGMTAAQAFALLKLSEAETMSLNELAARTVTDQSSVSTVVQKLVDQDLVSRERSTDDARRLELRVTRKGAAVLRKAPEPAQEKLLEALAELTPREQAQLAKLLARLVEAMGIEESPVPMFFQPDFRKRKK